MTAARTLRRPKRPLAYSLLVAFAAVLLAVCVVGAWSLGHAARQAPADIAAR